MQREEFLKAITYLGIVYSKDISQEQVAVWYPFFKDDGYEDLKQAIKRYCVKNRFFPQIADLKAEMAEDALEIETPDQAWVKVVQAISQFGYYQSEKAMASLPDLTRQAVANMGGFQRLCSSENNEWLRKDFEKVYLDMRTRGITRYVTGTTITIADVLEKQKKLEVKE